MHDEAEHQRSGLRRDHAEPCRLHDHGAVRGVPAQDGGERAGPAVLLAHDAGDAETAAQPDSGVADGLCREQRAAEAALHVHGAATVDAAVAHHRIPRRRRPGGLVADRHHVDVAVEQQVAAAGRPGDAVVCRLADPADDPQRLLAIDLVAPVRMRRQLLEVDGPDVGLESCGRHPLGDPPLRRRLPAVEARDRDQLAEERDEAVDVERVQRPPLGRAQLAGHCRRLTPGRATPAASDRSGRPRP